MIKTTVQEVREAYKAFVGRPLPDGKMDGGIGNAALPPKSAWRVSRLVTKLKSVVKNFEETQRKLMLDAGAVHENGMLLLKLAPRRDDEGDAAFQARETEHSALVNKLNDDVDQVTKEAVEVDYEPIPLSLFENERDPNKSPDLKPVDLANAGPFIKE